MAPPWADTPTRVVIEFKKSTGKGMTRRIELSKSPYELPAQLMGRVTPEVWAGFMTDVQQLADNHPYLQRPSANTCLNNAGALLFFLTIGFGCFQADGGDYGPWFVSVETILARNRPYFAHGGMALSLQQVHGSYWIQVDVNPAVAVGAPVVTGQPMFGAQPTYGAGPQSVYTKDATPS